MEFKDILKELRESSEISQKDLAGDLNLSPTSIALYETGKRDPSRKTMELIADYFNVSMDYLRGKECGSVYYLKPETAQIAKEIEKRTLLLELFRFVRSGPDEDLQLIVEIAKRLCTKNKRSHPLRVTSLETGNLKTTEETI